MDNLATFMCKLRILFANPPVVTNFTFRLYLNDIIAVNNFSFDQKMTNILMLFRLLLNI